MQKIQLSSSPPSTLPGFEVAHAVDRMLGQPTLWWEAVGLFIQHFAQWEADWQATQGNHEAERRCVHALRSGAANVGADQLASVAGVLEELLAKRCVGQAAPIPQSVREYLKACFRESWQTAADAYYAPPLAAAIDS